VEFLVYEVVGELLEIKKCLRGETEHMNYEILRVLIVLLGDKQEAKWGDF